MKYADYLAVLDNHIASRPLKLGDGKSVLALLYESYEELQRCSSGQIKEDFHELYLLLNGMPPRDMDKIIKFTRSKEKYKADHAAELKQFYQARRKLSAQFPDGKFDRHKLEAEYARLEQEHDETYAQFKSIRADSQQLWKIKSCVDSARKNQEQTQQQNHRRQEQEI